MKSEMKMETIPGISIQSVSLINSPHDGLIRLRIRLFPKPNATEKEEFLKHQRSDILYSEQYSVGVNF